jgi:hypothetical protein
MHGPQHVVIPADPRYLEVLRMAAAILVEDAGGRGELLRDLVLAVDEVAATLIEAAEEGGVLEMSSHREDDLYVRLTVPIGRGAAAPTPGELTRQLLETTTDSFDLAADQGRLVGTLQAEIAHDGT